MSCHDFVHCTALPSKPTIPCVMFSILSVFSIVLLQVHHNLIEINLIETNVLLSIVDAWIPVFSHVILSGVLLFISNVVPSKCIGDSNDIKHIIPSTSPHSLGP